MAAFEGWELEVVHRQVARWNIPRGASVLEVGCGSGRLSPLLLDRIGADGTLVSVDISLGMLMRARQRAAARWIGATAEDLPFGERQFHLCICFQVLPHFVDRRRAFDEFARVLVRGGFLWIAHTLPQREVNALHQALGPPVDDHVLPRPEELADEARCVGFDVGMAEDGSDGYLICFSRS